MANKTILITGASTGIGYATAQLFCQQHYQVAVTVRTQQDKKALEALGCFVQVLDLEQTDEIAQVFNNVLQHFDGQLDLLFNNAAYGQVGAIEDLSVACLRKQFEVNLFSWHELTRLAVKQMRKQNDGCIVQCSSVLGLVCMPYRGAYNASKFALEAYTDTLRMELADTAIHVCLIEPGPIHSAFRANALANFKQTIAVDDSVHKSIYQQQIQRLSKKGLSNRFTLQPEACAQKVWRIAHSRRPKPRYYVTFPTYLFAFLRRVLSARQLDKLLSKS